MQLLSLTNGRKSLEFAASDWPIVQTRLRQLGPMTSAGLADGEMLEVLGEKFFRMNDWDDPCLISSSPAGDKILASVVSEPQRSGAGKA